MGDGPIWPCAINERARERASKDGPRCEWVMLGEGRGAMDRIWPRGVGEGGCGKGGCVWCLSQEASRARSAWFHLTNRPFRGGNDVTSKVLPPACAVVPGVSAPSRPYRTVPCALVFLCKYASVQGGVRVCVSV